MLGIFFVALALGIGHHLKRQERYRYLLERESSLRNMAERVARGADQIGRADRAKVARDFLMEADELAQMRRREFGR